MRSALLLLVLVAGLAAVVGQWAWERRARAPQPAALAVRAAPPPPAPVAEPPSPPHLGWDRYSWSGGARLVHGATAPGECRVRCEADGGTAWSGARCLGEDSDPAFVAEGCRLAVVLWAYPLVGRSLDATPVGVVAFPDGGTTPLTLGQLVKRPAALRPGPHRVRWLAGTLEEPGPSPRWVEDGGRVEVETLDGARQALTLEELATLPRAAPPPPASTLSLPGGPGLYTYLDEEGTLHVVQGWSAVPPARRSTAKPMGGSVETLAGGPPEPASGRPPAPVLEEAPPPRRERQPAPPPGPGREDDVPRNELGEDWIQYSRRIQPTLAPGQRRIQRGPIRTCAPDGSACRAATDCCGGTCASGLCGAASCRGQGEACARGRDCCSGACTSGSCR